MIDNKNNTKNNKKKQNQFDIKIDKINLKVTQTLWYFQWNNLSIKYHKSFYFFYFYLSILFTYEFSILFTYEFSILFTYEELLSI